MDFNDQSLAKLHYEEMFKELFVAVLFVIWINCSRFLCLASNTMRLAIE